MNEQNTTPKKSETSSVEATIFSDDFEITYTDEANQNTPDSRPDLEINKDSASPEIARTPSKKKTSSKGAGSHSPEKVSMHSPKITSKTASVPKKSRKKKKSSGSSMDRTRKTFKNVSSAGTKTVKAGGNLIKFTGKLSVKLIDTLLRYATLFLIAGIIGLFVYHFYQGSSALGGLSSLTTGKNYELAAYLGVGVFLVLLACFAFLRAMTRQTVIVDSKRKKIDTGRGLFFFPILLAGSYLSGALWPLIPVSPSAANGARTAVQLYGTLHGTLLVLCAAGMISCVIRAICGYISQR